MVTMNTEKVAKIIGVSKSTILRWISTGLIKDVKRDNRGWRVWSEQNVQQLTEFKESYWGLVNSNAETLGRGWRSNLARSMSTFRPDKYTRRKET
jgi:transposase